MQRNRRDTLFSLARTPATGGQIEVCSERPVSCLCWRSRRSRRSGPRLHNAEAYRGAIIDFDTDRPIDVARSSEACFPASACEHDCLAIDGPSPCLGRAPSARRATLACLRGSNSALRARGCGERSRCPRPTPRLDTDGRLFGPDRRWRPRECFLIPTPPR